MTTILKLGIQGIRSFDHEHMEIIDFETPVTLIVGPNGSGKTTIIECLKMASCGQLPPNTRNGHGFIHDPVVAHLPEVKAQIRMLFKAGQGPKDKEICAIRSFQLTNKKVAGKIKPTFKAVDSVLRTMADDGSRASLSARCADMDSQVPELMGVSRAVLETVIFCHQEDSSWPLQDASSVKKRFDDIFGATRYTKALQNIKDLQKEWTKTTRDRRAEAEVSQAHMDQATKLATQREDRLRMAEEITGELRMLDGQLASAAEAQQRAETEVAQYDSCGVRVAELRGLHGRCERERQEVARNMEERGHDVYRESHVELQQQAKQFEERTLPESLQKVKQAKAALAAGESSFHMAMDTTRKLREDMGETVAAAEVLASRKTELATRLQNCQEQSVAAAKTRLDRMSYELARLERDQRQRDAAAEEALNAAERAFREASLEASRNESRADDAVAIIRRLEEEAQTLARAVPDLDSLMRTMRENEAALTAEGSDARLRRLEARQEEIGRRRHDLQYSISRKSSEVAQLEAQSDAHVEVDALRRRLREGEAELSGKLGELRPRLESVLGQAPEAFEADAKVAVGLQQADEQLKRQRLQLQEAQNRVSTALARTTGSEAELRRMREDDARLAAELGVPAAGVGGATGAAVDFSARLAAQREQVDLARKDLAMTESAKHMYEKFREKSRAKNACQFCRRCFDSPTDRSTFEDTVERLIVKIPAFLEESHRRLTEAQDEMTRLEAHRPKWDRIAQLRQVDMPRKQKETGHFSEEARVAQAALEPEMHGIRRMEEKVQELQNLRTDASALQRMVRNVEDLRAGARAKEARLLGANSKVSLQAERDQLRTLQEQLVELGREEDSVRTQRDLLSKQQEQLRTQLAEQKGRLQLLQVQVARRGDVDTELAARQIDHRDCSEVAKRARAAAEAAGARTRVLQQERKEVTAKFRKESETRDGDVRKLQREVDALTDIEKAIEVMQGRVESADILKAKMASADESCRQAERELEGLRARLESEEERLRKRQEVRECLTANLRLKKLEAEAQQHESEIAGLLRELGGRDLEQLRQTCQVARVQAMELHKQRSFREGELAQTREAVRGVEMELESPLYANVAERHRQAIIKHESAAFAARDLARYHTALDKALMKFHTLKMAEINRTVKDLWQRVYRGRDIDYVAIRSDTDDSEHDAGSEFIAGRARVSYNYRVVMVCGDAEMDMRGRCSAGQRVLCSLIIRLALADSFCVNCGVLALDEPTVNLDGPNIRGLAEALSSLIEARRNHSRFQLVLITHDEAFVDHLCQLQVADWYYHIRKDDRGCSKIDRRDMRFLGG